MIEHVQSAGQPLTAKKARERLKFYEKFQTQLELWGPEPVISAFHNWRRTESQAEEGNEEEDVSDLLAWEKVVLAMREDLGVENKDLAEGDLLRLFILDIDDHLPSTEVGPDEQAAQRS